MAKKVTSTELLGEVLDDLDELLKMSKKAEKEEKASNIPASTIGKALNSNGGINNIAASLNTIGSINVLAKVKKKDVDHVVDIMSSLSTAIKGFLISEEEAKGFDRLMASFSSITQTFSSLSENVFKSFFKFSPARGWIIGRRIGKFYKRLLQGFESAKLKDVLKPFKSSKNLGNNLAGFSQLIATLFAIDWKQLLKVGWALLLFPAKGGQNFADFINPILKVIESLPKDHKQVKVTGMFGNNKEESFTADTRIKSFMDIFNMFASVSLKSIRHMAKLGKKLNKELGTNIAEFFTEIITMITANFKENKTFKGQLKSFEELFKVFTSIPLLKVLSLKFMGMVMNEKLGAKIGGFFSALVKKITEPGEKKAETAVKMVKAFTMMLLALTISFVALVAIVALAKPLLIIAAAALLVGLVGLSLFTIKKLSDKKVAANSKGALMTAGIISVLFLVLTGCFAIMVAIVTKNKFTDILLGTLLLVAIVGLSLFVLKKLSSKKVANNTKGALATAGVMILIMLAMTAIAAIAILIGLSALESALGLLCVAATILIGLWAMKRLAKFGRDKAKLWNAILAAGAITLAIIALSVGLMVFAGFTAILKKVGLGGAALGVGVAAIVVLGVAFLLKRMSKMSKAKMMIGVAGLGAVTLGCLGIAEAMNIFGDYLLKIKQLTLKDVALGLGVSLAVIAAVIAIMVAAAACISGPLAIVFAIGLAAASTVSLAIMEIGGSLSVFCDFLIKTKQLTVQDVENAALMISGNKKGNMMGCLKDIITSLSKFGPWAAIKVAIIGKALAPVFEALSQFVDVIQKMANMQIVDHFEKDKNGNQVPIYRKMTNAEFIAAAVTLSKAFTYFMNQLLKEFNSKEKLKQIKAIMKTFKKGDVGQLMEALGSFAKAIVDFASLQVPDEWNQDGAATHYSKLNMDDFKNAAITLAKAFSTFITTLRSNMNNHEKDIKELLKMFKDKGGNSVMNLIDTVTHCIDPLAQLASGRWGNGDDKNAPKITRQTLLDAVDTLIDPVLRLVRVIKSNADALWAANNDAYPFKCMADTMKYVGDKITSMKTDTLVKHGREFFKGSQFIFATMSRVRVSYSANSRIYRQILDNVAKGLKNLYPIARKSWKPIRNNMVALKKFDSELIGQRDARNAAITEITSNFHDMNDEMVKFNDNFKQALDMFEKYLDLKKKDEETLFTKFKNDTTEVFHKVGETVTKTVDKIDETIHPKNPSTGEPVDSNAALVNALTGALNAWAKTTKNVTLELSDSGVKAIGKVYLK